MDASLRLAFDEAAHVVDPSMTTPPHQVALALDALLAKPVTPEPAISPSAAPQPEPVTIAPTPSGTGDRWLGLALVAFAAVGVLLVLAGASLGIVALLLAML